MLSFPCDFTYVQVYSIKKDLMLLTDKVVFWIFGICTRAATLLFTITKNQRFFCNLHEKSRKMHLCFQAIEQMAFNWHCSKNDCTNGVVVIWCIFSFTISYHLNNSSCKFATCLNICFLVYDFISNDSFSKSASFYIFGHSMALSV